VARVVKEKVEKNDRKYPVEKVAGSIARGKGPVPAGMERIEEKRAA
jgi:hypothetical protein